MKILFFSVNMERYTSASYQQDLIQSLEKKIDTVFWGPGYDNFDINLNLEQIKKKLHISDFDSIVVGHSWLSDIPSYERDNLKDHYSWIDSKLINKSTLEFCGKLNFFEHPGKKIFLLNKEYVSLGEKLNFASQNKFDYVLTSNTNFEKYAEKTKLNIIFFPYAISSDFIITKNINKSYDLFFSGLIQNQLIFNLNKIESKRSIIQKKLFYSFSDIPLFRRKNFNGKIFWNAFTGIRMKDYILKILGKYKRMPRSEYIKKLHQSNLVLNTLSPDNLIGPRFYETMAAKAICLSEDSVILNKVFEPMTHYVPLNSPDEIYEKLNFCLSDSLQIKKIRNNAFNYVVENHTYDIRAQKIKKLLEN
jgi:hypothetical protein